ncbi:MAG TPA: two-component regulator propeller domain-containing protein [Bryobacteraceae bacterium]|nr:two-component regulator propeller domain-containing protein [Candidatus Acidoferrales bacterium]
MSGSRTTREIRRALLLCACAAIGSHALSALNRDRTFNQYIATRWSARDSFPGGAINAIAQTPDGYLWIGAENGLVRFDGISFRLIDHSNSPSLPPGHVLGLFVDAEGSLWVRMQTPYLMRYRDGSFEQMYPAKVPPPFSSARELGATAAIRGASGGALIATPGAPLRYIAGKFTPVLFSGAARGTPTSIAETADGAVWIGMRDTGLFCVRDGHGSQVGLPNQKVNALLPVAGSELWIGTDSGLVHWDGSAITRRGIPTALARSAILALARDRDSNLWISTPAGITRMNSKGSTLHWKGGRLPGAVHAIFEDREGNLWFGGTDGLMQLRHAPFLSYPGVADEGASLYIDASGRTWIAPSSGGLLWIRGAEHHAITIQGIDRDVIYSISGGPGEVWVGRRLGGVTRLREEAGVLQGRTYTARDGLAPGVVSAVNRSRDGSVWAGTLSGAVSHIEKGRITTFTTTNGLSGDAVTTIREAPDGVIWVGTAGGLEAYRNGAWRKYDGEDGLPPGRVDSLALDRHGILWIGSASGLFYWSGSRIESARNAPDSLHGKIYGLAVDHSGNLWVATDRHVVSVPRALLLGRSKGPAAVRQFSMADGLPSTRGVRRDHSVVKDPSGRIWFSLLGGLCVVNPAHPAALAPALVEVESVVVDGRPLGTGPTVRYPSNRRRVVFNFIGVSLAVPRRVRYRYRLDGYDTDWSQPSESRQAAYTNLPPARYTFRVMASNSEGLWNGAPASIRLDVEPRLSETWWFRATGLCLIAAAIFAGFRYRLARIHAAVNLRFEERLAERTRIARELHDTLLQSFQGLMLRLQVVDDLLPPGKAKDQLEQSLERADQAIAEGRSAVYGLRSSATTTNDLGQAVRALGDELAAQDSTAFHLVVEGPARDLHPIIRDELYRITREALRNAFKHAAAHHIETEMTYGERAFRLRIRDDGRGIPAEMLEEGRPGHYGLSGMRERAQQIGAKLEIWSGAKAGTEIELSIAGSVAYTTSTGRPLFHLFRKRRVDL